MDLDTAKLLYDLSDISIYINDSRPGWKYLVIKRKNKFEKPEKEFKIHKDLRTRGYGMIIALGPKSIQFRTIECTAYKKIPNYQKLLRSMGRRAVCNLARTIPWNLKYEIKLQGVVKKTKKNSLKILGVNHKKLYKNGRGKKLQNFKNITDIKDTEKNNIEDVCNNFVGRNLMSLYSPELTDLFSASWSKLSNLEQEQKLRERLSKRNCLAEIVNKIVYTHYQGLEV